jgi:hypothetical protein
MKNKVTKISTVTRKDWEMNPSKYEQLRNSVLEYIVNSEPKFNLHITVSNKPF